MGRRPGVSLIAKRQIQTLGDNIRMARLRRDLSLRAVAERAGVSLSTVVAIEDGEVGVSIGSIAAVLHCLNLLEDLSLVAKDDVLGRKLQDLELEPKKRATRRSSRQDIHEFIIGKIQKEPK